MGHFDAERLPRDGCDEINEAEDASSGGKGNVNTSRLDHETLSERSLDFETLVIVCCVNGSRNALPIVLDTEHGSVSVLYFEQLRIEAVAGISVQAVDVHLVDLGSHGITDRIVSVKLRVLHAADQEVL